MSKVKCSIWGREFVLDISYDEYDGFISHEQFEAAAFIADGTVPDSGLDKIKSYIIKNNNTDDNIDPIANIFEYIMPSYVYIPASENLTYIIMCDFKFDLEHGVAIVYNKRGFVSINAQDEVL